VGGDEQAAKLFEAAEAIRHLADDLVMHGQHDRISGRLQPQHRLGEQVARDRLHDVLGP